ncbi:MAG TPA: DsbC family protein, partial [Burkholderiaceae bacterium]|nr:DsbC family protein [Burkholderiaceae bacterium]
MNYARLAVAGLLALAATSGWANEAVIKKALAERLPGFKVDEVRPTPMPGVWEVRTGSELRYTDAAGNYLIEGEMLDLRAKKNLTEERVAKLTAVEFGNLPLKDAVVWKNGNGKRRIAVFADPNCGYCKRFERTLQDVK